MELDQIIIIVCFVVMWIQAAGFGIYLKKNHWSMSGVPPINKVLFKFAKACMMLTWVSLFVEGAGLVQLSLWDRSGAAIALSIVFLISGTILQLGAYFELGHNLKFGIPSRDEEKRATLKVTGLYRISRNPMYVGFYFLMLSACFYVLNPVVWIFSIFAFIVHHQIVLKEESFLEKRFGSRWKVYSDKVNRYL